MNNYNSPINQCSLQSLEKWLKKIGAYKDIHNPSTWYLQLSNCRVIISFEQEDLRVEWDYNGILKKRLFSYSINLEDVENAILQGP